MNGHLPGGPKRNKTGGSCMMMFFRIIVLEHVLKFTGKQVRWNYLFPSKHTTSFQRLKKTRKQEAF